jgi:hypothetical protein
MRQKKRVRRGKLRQGRADVGAVAKQKKGTFLAGEVFFLLTRPLMGDPFMTFEFEYLRSFPRATQSHYNL